MLLLAACAGETPSAPAHPTAVDAGTCSDYLTVGAPTLTTWCTACHSSALAGTVRNGAPDGVDLDTLAGARTWADRVRARALDARDMPYGGGIPEAERARFEAWLDCGLPGDELAWPASTRADRPDEATDRNAELLDDGGDLLLVVSWGGVDREILRFRKIDRQAFWVEEAYAGADGAPTWSRSWDPPLRVWDDLDDWTETVTATREQEGEVTTVTETWTFARGPADAVDARLRDQDPEQLVTTSSSGESYTWLLSTVTSFAERRRDTAVEEDLSLGLTTPIASPIEGFPIEAGRTWTERGHTRRRGAE